MDLKSRILICEQDEELVKVIKSSLENNNFNTEIITDATQLVSRSEKLKPAVVVVNPDMTGFNDYDVCKHIIKELNIPVILIVEKTSATRVYVDECRPQDVFTKPFNVDDLVNLVSKQVTLSNN